MKKLIIVLIGSCLFFSEAEAQFTRYVVKLKNKDGTPFSFSAPTAYLSQKAINRRTKYGIALDSTDLPVTPSYLSQITAVANVTVLNVSKWHNSVAIQTSDPNAITTLNALSFVQSVSPIAARIQNSSNQKFTTTEQAYTPSQRSMQITTDFFNYGTGSLNEINLHKGQFLHNIGLRGQGMVIAMLDGGFFNYNIYDAMDSIIVNNQVLDTWDFYTKNTTVTDDAAHGMQCLSTIAANIPGVFIGKAPKANFMLYRTEDVTSEYPIEEINMVCGMERADSAGADLISASIGYFDFDDPVFNHAYADMNGNTTISAIGADLAAKKGILFVSAAGNEGGKPWHYILTPADGDSVLAVAAVSTNGDVGVFSSYGPSSDGQVKPDVASVGVGAMVQSTINTVGTSNGTSFACPNMAGLSAILWQGFPEVNNMRIVKALREAGSIASAPNDRIGYGIPDLKSAFGTLLTEFATSTSTIDTCTATINWTSKDVRAMKYEIERKLPGQANYTKVGELNPQAGNILANHSYQFSNTIMNSASGPVSYRIRQIIDTAAATFMAVYIDTTSVSIVESCFANFLVSIATSNATLNDCSVTISWRSRDIGSMKYEIERKGPGETNFTKVGELSAAAGVSLAPHNYEFINKLATGSSGAFSFRIKQIIDTAAASFAAVYIDTTIANLASGCVVTAVVNPGTIGNHVTVRPNPSLGSSATLIIETTDAVPTMPILIYNMNGRLVQRLQESKGSGRTIIDIPVSKLAKGKYFINVYDKNKLIGTAEFIRL